MSKRDKVRNSVSGRIIIERVNGEDRLGHVRRTIHPPGTLWCELRLNSFDITEVSLHSFHAPKWLWRGGCCAQALSFQNKRRYDPETSQTGTCLVLHCYAM